jgi:ribosomal-protein-alanine N-acetyltransferase
MDEFTQPLIRKIKEIDFRAVAEITNKHFSYMSMTPSKIAARISRGFFYFVAVVDGKIAGFVDIEVKEKQARVIGLAVEDEFRGRGIGSALIAEAVEFAGSAGKRAVYLTVRQSNMSAIKFYERQGFIVARELEKRGEGFYIMCRKLET